MDELQLCRGNEEQIRKSLQSIPDTIEAVYNQVLENVKKYDIEPAQSIFRWLCVAKRPLSQTELAKAAGLSHPADIMRICTSNLITSTTEEMEIDGRKESCEIIRFAHFSVNEHLMSENLKSTTGKASRFYVSTDKAHAYVSSSCLDHLHGLNGQFQSKQLLLYGPLLHYSAQYWHVHVKSFESSHVDAMELVAVKGKIHDLFRPTFCRSYVSWLILADPDEFNNPGKLGETADAYPEPLYYALLLGFDDIGQKLILEGADPDGRSGHEGNALQLAAHRGYISTVERLLEKGADPNRAGKANGSALYAAVIQGHEDIVDVLTAAGADVNKQEGYYGNALQIASYFGYYIITRHLLGSNADVNATGGIFGTALQAACAADHVKLVSFLLGFDADPNRRLGLLASPLQAALMGSDIMLLHTLMEHGVKYNTNGARAWKMAYMTLWKDNAPLMRSFEHKLRSSQEIPPELTSPRQLLAAIMQRSSKDAMPNLRSKQVPTSDSGKRTWERLLKLIEVSDAENDKPEDSGYLESRTYWTATRLAAVSQIAFSMFWYEIDIDDFDSLFYCSPIMMNRSNCSNLQFGSYGA